jgi:hypothetical protein
MDKFSLQLPATYHTMELLTISTKDWDAAKHNVVKLSMRTKGVQVRNIAQQRQPEAEVKQLDK